jgi:hypothetical protein
MAFFFPEAHAAIDWARGYESLDTELQQIVRDAALGTRLADKPMKVWRRDGAEQIILIHTEIQGGPGCELCRAYVRLQLPALRPLRPSRGEPGGPGRCQPDLATEALQI